MSVDLAERYAAAERLLPHRWSSLVFSGRVQPHWLGDDDRFWYRDVTPEGARFVLVDPPRRTMVPAFDHERAAGSLTAFLRRPIAPGALPFTAIDPLEGRVRAVVGERWVELSFDTYACSDGGPAPTSGELRSPNARWAAFVRDHDLFVRDATSGSERALTTDGAACYSYATPPEASALRSLLETVGASRPPLVVWSPDSTRLVTHRIDERELPLMHLVRSSPSAAGRPEGRSYRYAMVGEPKVATAELVVFDVRTGRVTPAKCPPFATPLRSPVSFHRLWWSGSGAELYWISGDRADKTVQLRAMDPISGEVRTLVEETSSSTVNVAPLYGDLNVRVLATGEVLWWSQRSGWGHLYVYDAAGNERRLTSGEWLVRDLVAVDESARVAVIAGAGREPDLDPYARQLYRLAIDTGELTRMTRDHLDHLAVGSPSGRFAVDVSSWIDAPARSAVIEVEDGAVTDVGAADASRLVQAGYEPPERFCVKAADGVTDIYGLLHRPRDFDPAERYPVIDDIYPGPQSVAAQVRYPRAGGEVETLNAPASLAALGFVVVVVDGRGTPLRSSAFQEHGRGSREGEYLEDHIAALRQLAATRPWLDLGRVGIIGYSGGGYAAARAVLRHPEFYKVAVAISGDHDDAMYHAAWGEKFIAANDWASQANASLAHELRGKLLLIHGEMDDNVTPHLTMRLVDALIAANKDFDLLIVPNAEHTMYVHKAYWVRRCWDFFVRHLLGADPPAYRIGDIPVDQERIGEMIGG